MSDTPITDAHQVRFTTLLAPEDAMWVPASKAREIERELTSTTEERDALREEVKSLKESIRDQEHHIMELERLRRYSPGPHMGQD